MHTPHVRAMSLRIDLARPLLTSFVLQYIEGASNEEEKATKKKKKKDKEKKRKPSVSDSETSAKESSCCGWFM
jgi:hypothetical protein